MREIRRAYVLKKKNKIKTILKRRSSFQYNNPFYLGWAIKFYKKYFIPDWKKPVLVGKYASTPTAMRGFWCSHLPRIYGVSKQEFLSSLNAIDELEELGIHNMKVKNTRTKYGDIWYYD